MSFVIKITKVNLSLRAAQTRKWYLEGGSQKRERREKKNLEEQRRGDARARTSRADLRGEVLSKGGLRSPCASETRTRGREHLRRERMHEKTEESLKKVRVRDDDGTVRCRASKKES